MSLTHSELSVAEPLLLFAIFLQTEMVVEWVDSTCFKACNRFDGFTAA